MINITPDIKLHELADLFKSRNAEYGNTYMDHGDALLAIFHGRIPEITNPKDAARIGVINMLVSKLCRYTANWDKNGHIDSLDDISVYSQMLVHIDQGYELNGCD